MAFLRASGLPAPILVSRTQGLAGLCIAFINIKLQCTTLEDEREAAMRMGGCLVRRPGLQAGLSPSCLSTASSARGLN